MTLPVAISLLPSRCRGPVRHGRGVLLLASGGIGDNILFSTVVDRFVEMADPGEPVTLLMRRDAIGSAFLFPSGISIETYDWKRFRRNLSYRWSLCAKMRKKNLRLVVSTDYDRHPFVDEIIIAACGTAAWAERARPSRKYEKPLCRNARFFDVLIDTPCPSHRLMHWVNLAKGLTGKDRGLPSFAPSHDQDGAGKDVVVIHPFSSDSRRELSAETFAAILREIPQRFQRVLSCTQDDLARHPEWRGFLEKFALTVDASPLQVKFETLKTAAMLITVDTSLVHLGALAGTTTLCLCTNAYRGWTVPYEDAFAATHVQFYTAPCEQCGCLGQCVYPLEKGTFRCLAHLPMNRVLEKIQDITRTKDRADSSP